MYMLAAVQSLSAIFILWAIIRLYIASGKSLTIKELVKQKFITLHLVMLILYLISLCIFYIYFSMWDSLSLHKENSVFVSFTICSVLIFLVQVSLIFLFISLSKPESPDKPENS